MCGRFVITSPPAALRQIFGYAEQPNVLYGPYFGTAIAAFYRSVRGG